MYLLCASGLFSILCSKCHTRHLACAIRDPQGENRGHENVKERCTVRLLVYYIFYGFVVKCCKMRIIYDGHVIARLRVGASFNAPHLMQFFN